MANQGISVHVKITIDPKDKETFLAALKPTFEAVKAEPLNTFFELSYDEKNPGVFELVESWNCTADYILKTQLQKDYYKPYRAAVEPLLLKPFEVEIFTRMGNDWASVNPDAYAVRA